MTSNEPIRFYRLDDVCSSKSISTVPWFSFTHDWYGREQDVSIAFRLTYDSEVLSWEVMAHGLEIRDEKDAAADDYAESVPIFLEGLWEETVFEIFLHSKNSPRYLELHMAPKCAWWFMWFADYRARVNEPKSNDPMILDSRASGPSAKCLCDPLQIAHPIASCRSAEPSVRVCNVSACNDTRSDSGGSQAGAHIIHHACSPARIYTLRFANLHPETWLAQFSHVHFCAIARKIASYESSPVYLTSSGTHRTTPDFHLRNLASPIQCS